MNDREILSNAIDKAIANGFKFRFYDKDFILDNLEDDNLPIESCYIIIFSHSFAKAFWGDEKYVNKELIEMDKEEFYNDYDDNATLDGNYFYQILSTWEYHLQQMVLEEEPIKYLEKYL